MWQRYNHYRAAVWGIVLAGMTCLGCHDTFGPAREKHVGVVPVTKATPADDLVSGDQVADMAAEDAAALRVRPASQPSPRATDVRRPRLNRTGRGIGP